MSNNVQVVLSVNQANFSAAMREAQNRLDTFAGKARGAGHSTVSSMQAASASIRLFEGGMTNNIRAVERFISTIPGVGAALKAAFPVVGAAALAGLLVKMGTEFAAFIKKANDTPRALAEGFNALGLSQRTATDELTKTNDQLKNQLAILDGKPVNNAAIAIDDARLAADKLAESLQTDRDKLTALLKDNALGIVAGAFTHQASTGGVSDIITGRQRELANEANAVTIAQHKYGVGSDQDVTAQATLARRHAQIEAEMEGKLAQLNEDQTHHVSGLRSGGSGATADQTARITDVSGYLAQLQGEDDQQTALATNAQISAQLKQKQDANAAAAKVKEAQEAIVKAWQQGLANIKAQRDMSVGEEANYWLTLAGTVKTGSLSYTTALNEANKDMAQEQKELAIEHAKWQAAQIGPDSSVSGPDGKPIFGTLDSRDLSKDSDYTRGIEEQSKSTVEFLHNLNQGVAIQRQNANAIAEASIKMAVAQGTMSRLDAAQVQTQLHTQEYTEQLKELQDALEAVHTSSTLSPSEKNAQTTALQNQIAQLNGGRAIQVAEDNSAIDMNTVGGSIRQALSVYVQEATDTGKQISDILTNAFNSVNSALSSSITAHAYSGQEYLRNIRNSLSGAARGIGSQGLDSVFKSVEGSVLKSFGVGGKADGSQSNPLWVRIAGSLGSAVGGTVATAASKVGGFFGKMFAPFQGFFADGGDVLANRPAMIGENGPELWVPPSSGTIVPNDAIGGTNHYWSVDARGSNDPAATAAAVNRAMRQALPQAVAASMHAQREQMKRRPASRR